MKMLLLLLSVVISSSLFANVNKVRTIRCEFGVKINEEDPVRMVKSYGEEANHTLIEDIGDYNFTVKVNKFFRVGVVAERFQMKVRNTAQGILMLDAAATSTENSSRAAIFDYPVQNKSTGEFDLVDVSVFCDSL